MLIKILIWLLLTFSTICYFIGWLTTWVILWIIKIPFITYKYLWKYLWGRQFILGMLLLTIYAGILGVINHYKKLADIQTVIANSMQYKALKAEDKTDFLIEENEDLKLSLKIATASAKSQKLTPLEAKEMINKTFPVSIRERFAKVTMQCENGTLESNRRNINTDGSFDLGLSQINSKWHRDRVERMFGMDFEVAMGMPLLNYIYAAYLYEHSGNLDAWVCNRLIK